MTDITNLKGNDLWAALTTADKISVQRKPRKRKSKAKAKPKISDHDRRLLRWADIDPTTIKNGTWVAAEVIMFCVDFECLACGHTCLQPAYPDGKSNIALKLVNTHNKYLTRYSPAYALGPDTSRLPSRRIVQGRKSGVCPHCFNATEKDEIE